MSMSSELSFWELADNAVERACHSSATWNRPVTRMIEKGGCMSFSAPSRQCQRHRSKSEWSEFAVGYRWGDPASPPLQYILLAQGAAGDGIGPGWGKS